MQNITENLGDRVVRAVASYWLTRQRQKDRQNSLGRKDQGARSAVTGGAQMDGFINLLTDILQESDVHKDHIFRKKRLELPGFFRPTKEWDLLVIREEQLIIALEAKSQAMIVSGIIPKTLNTRVS